MNKRHPGPEDEKKKSTADYYKLKTEAVEDLVTADDANSPPVSKEELEKYGARKKKGIPNWLKVCFIKWWFPGAVCFFMIMGVGIWNPLDQVVIVGIVQGIVTDLLTNNMLRFFAETDGSNDGWLMFPKQRYATFFFNMAYAMVLCTMVLFLYAGVDALCNLVMGTTEVEYLKTGPVFYGLAYMLSDNLLVGLKNLLKGLVSSRKSKNV